MSKIIAIDGNEANVSNRVGISEYAFELLKEFRKISDKRKNLNFVIYLKSKPLDDFPKKGDNWSYRIIGPGKFWTQIALPWDLFTHFPKPDVFFTPSHYAPRFSPIPTAISVMDVSYIKFPNLFKKNDLYQLQNWTKYSLRHAAKVFTISLASKDDIIKEYKIASDKVVVTYPGLKALESARSDMKKGDYLLFVGTLQPRKNLERLIEAFSKITNEFPGLKLIIAGKKGWLYEDILNAPKRYGVENKVEFLDFIDNSKLPELYKKAKCFVFPSLYEGFGLPILEAMKYGCPVITSNISSLPEVGGNAALYVDPENTQDIAEKIKKVMSDDNLRKEMIKKGYAQIKKFSWEKTAKETLKVLEEIVNER